MYDHEFTFDLSIEAADKNASILIDKYGGNLSDAIDTNSRSILGYGSEFRPTELIAKIYKNHPCWDRMRNILLHGSDWPLEPIIKEQRVADVLITFVRVLVTTRPYRRLYGLVVTSTLTSMRPYPLEITKERRLEVTSWRI